MLDRSPSTTRLALVLAVSAVAPSGLSSQTPAPAPARQPAAPTVNVSGLIFGNYQYQLSGQTKDFNQFLLDRAYVNVRATLGERMSARITTDVFQSGDQNGWTIRAKYAYFQYDWLKRATWNAGLRVGMLQNLLVEHVETFWPRFVSQVAFERSGGFASADVGAAGLLTLPGRFGEVYAQVINGPGYTRRETDRFKDYGARVSITPLAARTQGFFSTLTISPWFYEGAIASTFVNGGAGGAISPVGTGLARDRYGVFVGLRDPRLTLGADIGRMHTVTDAVSTVAPPVRVVTDARANVTSGFAILRPLAFATSTRRSPLGLIARYDAVESNTARDDKYHFLIAGLLFDLNTRSTLVLDYQEQLRNSGTPTLPAPGAFRTAFAHVVVNF